MLKYFCLKRQTNKQTDGICARALEEEKVNKTWDLDPYITDINFIV